MHIINPHTFIFALLKTYMANRNILLFRCTIDWQKGKNVTVKVIKKTQKHKGRGTKRTVTKTVQADSFFNFFNPPDVPEGEEVVNSVF